MNFLKLLRFCFPFIRLSNLDRHLATPAPLSLRLRFFRRLGLSRLSQPRPPRMLRTLSTALRGRGTAAARNAGRATTTALTTRCAAAASAHTHTSAAASAPVASVPAARSTASLYRSPLRSPDDRSFAHLWDDAWILDAPHPRYSVIWLHGLAQRKEDVRGMAEILAPPQTRFCVPQSPKLSISCMPDQPDQRAWFDLIEEKRDAAAEKAAGEPAPEDEAGLDEVSDAHSAHTHLLCSMSLRFCPLFCSFFSPPPPSSQRMGACTLCALIKGNS